MQNVGEQLHQQGMRFSTTFADHSHKMGNNGQIFGATTRTTRPSSSRSAGLIS